MPKKLKIHGTDNDGRTQIPFAMSFHAVRIDHFEPEQKKMQFGNSGDPIHTGTQVKALVLYKRP